MGGDYYRPPSGLPAPAARGPAGLRPGNKYKELTLILYLSARGRERSLGNYGKVALRAKASSFL